MARKFKGPCGGFYHFDAPLCKNCKAFALCTIVEMQDLPPETINVIKEQAEILWDDNKSGHRVQNRFTQRQLHNRRPAPKPQATPWGTYAFLSGGLLAIALIIVGLAL